MAHRFCSEFLQDFVLPLVVGGPLHVGKPFDPAEVEHMENELSAATEAIVAVDEARQAVVAELVINPPTCVFSVDELRLAAAIHNLLFLAHPAADKWTLSQSSRVQVIAAAQFLVAQPLPMDRTVVLARHAMFHNLFCLTRTDVVISWWTGSATFLGQEPPTRLTMWKNFRRVSRQESTADFHDLFVGADVSAVLAALIRRTPLSLLLAPNLNVPPLHWEDAVFVLRDPELARTVAYRSLEPLRHGIAPEEALRGPCRFAAHFEQMIERSPSEQDTRVVAVFLVHLNALLALWEPQVANQSPLLVQLLALTPRPRGLVTLLIMPEALLRIDPRIAQPPGEDDPYLQPRWRMHRQQVRDVLGDGLVESLVQRLRRHIRKVPLLGATSSAL